MPIVVTFDIEGAPPRDRNRIQSFFERLGWENLGGSSYRYPRLGSDQPVEDWFNHIIPALMLFRTYLISSGKTLSKFTLDVQASSGFNPTTKYGCAPTNVPPALVLYDPNSQAFGEKKLLDWLASVSYPYPK
jgi:hypothetical protein